MLLNAAKCQSYSFYRFWVIKGNLTGGGVKLTPPSKTHTQTHTHTHTHTPRLGLKWIEKLISTEVQYTKTFNDSNRYVIPSMGDIYV